MKPALLLLMGAALHYGWGLFPAEHQADMWNASGAIVRAILLLIVVWHIRSRAVLLIAAWFLAEEAMVAVCSLAYIAQPWQVLPGQAQCSALLSYDLGKLGLAAITLLLLCLPDKVDRVCK